jgi:amino acid transporter
MAGAGMRNRSLTGMTAVLGCFGSAMLACSRMLYALAREGFAPRAIATLHWLVNGLVPLLGIAIDGYVIDYAFFRTLRLPFKQGSIVWVGVAWELLGICWVVATWLRRPAARRQEPLVASVE